MHDPEARPSFSEILVRLPQVSNMPSSFDIEQHGREEHFSCNKDLVYCLIYQRLLIYLFFIRSLV